MFWYCFLPPELDALLVGGSGPVRPAAAFPDGPTHVDRWLVVVTYGVAAAEARCDRCGAALGTRSRLAPAPSADGTQGWSVAVLVRCRGLRRHRHLAVVTRRAGEMVLGPLRAV